MSGSVEPALPASITISQVGLTPMVSVIDGGIAPQPVGIPPYPLASDPSQIWWLTWQAGQAGQGGVLAWVQQPDAPDHAIFALEDAQGFLLLEDGEGAILMEA